MNRKQTIKSLRSFARDIKHDNISSNQLAAYMRARIETDLIEDPAEARYIVDQLICHWGDNNVTPKLLAEVLMCIACDLGPTL